MNQDQVKGRAQDVKGHLKEAAGDLTGNERLKQEGKLDQAEGKVRGTLGDAKEKVKDAVDKA